MESRLRISSTVVVITMVLLVSGSTNSQSKHDRWQYVTSAADRTQDIYLENKTEAKSNGNKIRWAKFDRKDGTQSVQLWEYDCKQRQQRLLQFVDYDSSGRVSIAEIVPLGELQWQTPVPDSIHEALFDTTCPTNPEEIPVKKLQPPTTQGNAPGQGEFTVDDIDDFLRHPKPRVYASGKDDLGVDYAIITATRANLREATHVNSAVILQIPKGDLVVLLAPDPVGGWYNVLHVKSNEEGWINTSTVLAYYTKNRKPNITIPSRDSGRQGNPSLEVKNDSEKTMALKLGEHRYVLTPQQSKAMTLVPGKYNFHASAPNVLPDFGEQYFQAGHVYTWRFYIVTVRR